MKTRVFRRIVATLFIAVSLTVTHGTASPQRWFDIGAIGYSGYVPSIGSSVDNGASSWGVGGGSDIDFAEDSNLGNGVAGFAQTYLYGWCNQYSMPLLYFVQVTINVNYIMNQTSYSVSDVATWSGSHEMGHALGLDHSAGGVMDDPYTGGSTYPTGGNFGYLDFLYGSSC